MLNIAKSAESCEEATNLLNVWDTQDITQCRVVSSCMHALCVGGLKINAHTQKYIRELNECELDQKGKLRKQKK